MSLKRARKSVGTKSRKKRTQTLSGLKKKAWKLLSETVRREAQYAAQQQGVGFVACYTCDDLHEWNDGLQAGHAIGGRNGAVLLDEEIIRPQCVRCNIMLRGNYGEFITRLITEKSREQTPDGYSLDAFRWWESKLLSAKQIKKWSREELCQKIDNYKERLSKLG